MMRNKLVFVLILAATLALSACGTAPQATAPRSMSVTGLGEVPLQPDIAYIYIGVHTEAESAAEAVSANNLGSQKLMSALEAAGVAAEDIRTSNFSIWTNTPYGADGMPTAPVYMVDNTIYLTVRDLAGLGGLLDAAVKAGANSINSIQFDVTDKSAALAEARAQAVKAARQQAEELAKAAGVTLGEVQSIQYYDATPYYSFEGKGMGGGGVAMEAPINPGTMQISATVTISYEIK